MDLLKKREMLRRFRSCNRLLHKCHQQNDPKGSFRGKGQLLSILSNKDGITQTKLAKEMDITRASMSELLSKMEKSKLIRRESDAMDKRVMRVFLTDLGKEKVLYNRQYTYHLSSMAFSKFSDEEMATLEPLLDRFVLELQKIANDEYTLQVKLRLENSDDFDKVTTIALDNNLELLNRESINYVDDLSFVATKDKEIVGYIICCKEDKTIEIKSFAVSKDLHNHGIGSSLLTETILKSQKFGYEKIKVVSNNDFFKIFGFEEYENEYQLSLDKEL